VLDTINYMNKEDITLLKYHLKSHRLVDERVGSLDKDNTAAHTAETATMDLKSEALFNLIEMERRLIFGPSGGSMP
jgi:hypothetical protein